MKLTYRHKKPGGEWGQPREIPMSPEQISLIKAHRKSLQEAREEAKRLLVEQGRAAWAWLHAEAEKGALAEDRITKEFEPMIPNYGCSCRAKWKAIRKPLTADQKQWAIDRHNDVNGSLGKPIWTPQSNRASG